MNIENIMKQDGKYLIVKSDPGRSERGKTVVFDYDWDVMRLSKKCLKAMGNPRYVTVMINPQERLLALEGTVGEQGSAVLVKKTARGDASFEAGPFLDKVADMMGWDTEYYSKMKFHGTSVRLPEGSTAGNSHVGWLKRLLPWIRKPKEEYRNMVQFNLGEAAFYRRMA